VKVKFGLLVVLILGSLFPTYADSSVTRIEVKIPSLKNEEILLCSYFNGLIYKQDSLYLSSSGQGVFQKEENYKEGIYLLLLKGGNCADFLLSDDQTLSIIITDTANIVKSMQVSGAEQSEIFQSFIRFIQDKKEYREQIVNQYQALSDEAKTKNRDKVQKQLDDLNNEVNQFQTDLINRYKDKWVGLFFQSIQPVMTGPYPNPKTQEEFDEEFKYQKEHFFDHINLQDHRFWRTNSFPQKVIDYMKKQVEQHPDSLAEAASRLVEKTRGDSISFHLMMNKWIDFSVNSKSMGMENIWAKLVEDYYHKGLVTWSDSTHLVNIEFEYNKLSHNRIGMQAYNMNLQDSTGKDFKLYDLAKKYTILYLYEPSCGHCIETTPKLYEQIYKKYAGKGLDIVSVCMITDRKEWLDFVESNHLEGEYWHNLWDPERKSYFWQFYDTSTTPSVYILDENKKIIAKKVNIDSIDMILNMLLNDN
jgi:peroxiredoxin